MRVHPFTPDDPASVWFPNLYQRLRREAAPLAGILAGVSLLLWLGQSRGPSSAVSLTFDVNFLLRPPSPGARCVYISIILMGASSFLGRSLSYNWYPSRSWINSCADLREALFGPIYALWGNGWIVGELIVWLLCSEVGIPRLLVSDSLHRAPGWCCRS